MGPAKVPLRFGYEDQRAQRAEPAARTSFTQVRAAVRRKTLLLLLWIDVDELKLQGAQLAGKLCGQCSYYMQLSRVSTLLPVAMGLLL